MKVKIKVNVPKGVPGVVYYGHTYQWRGKFYDMDKEYTIKSEDFNPAIMTSLEPQKAAEPEVEVPVEEPPTEEKTSSNAEGEWSEGTAAKKETPSLGSKKRSRK